MGDRFYISQTGGSSRIPSGQSVGVRIDQQAMNRLMKKISALPTAVRGKKLDHALEAATEPVEIMAKALVPVGDDGLLKKSIRHELKWEDGERVAWVGPWYKMAAHGHLVEFGHKMYYGKPGTPGRKLLAGGRKTRKKPFMRPAFDIAGNEAARIMGRELGKNVERQARRG